MRFFNCDKSAKSVQFTVVDISYGTQYLNNLILVSAKIIAELVEIMVSVPKFCIYNAKQHKRILRQFFCHILLTPSIGNNQNHSRSPELPEANPG